MNARKTVQTLIENARKNMSIIIWQLFSCCSYWIYLVADHIQFSLVSMPGVCVLWVGVNLTKVVCSYWYKGYRYFCNRISWRNTIRTIYVKLLFLFFRREHFNIFVIIAILMRTRSALIFLMFSTDYMKMVPTLLQLLYR